MKTIRKLGLVTAVLVCAALVMVPLASAAGPGQGFSPQGQSGQGQRNMMMPDNGGNGRDTGSGNGQNAGNGMPHGGAQGNSGQNPGAGTTPFSGNGTAPQRPPDQNFGNTNGSTTPPGPGGDLNLTALGNTLFGQLPPDVNATESNNWTMPFNATGPQPGWQNQHLQEGNLTAPGPDGGNTTPRPSRYSPAMEIQTAKTTRKIAVLP